MDLPQTIAAIAVNHDVLIYALVVLIAIVEGPIVSIAGGVLLRLDLLPSFWPLYVALMAGDLTGDILWYYIGAKAGQPFIARYGRFFNITETGVKKLEAIFHSHKNLILVGSKLTTGFGFAPAVLFTAGLVRLPFRRYLVLNVLGQFVWTGGLIFIGYFFTHLYSVFNNLFARLSITAAVALIAFAVFRAAKYARDTIIRHN
ncbi:MAG: DedA family protein [Patescibacteria group bacterium]|nr:DedA family protein [Patescibacteria group bacterium]